MLLGELGLGGQLRAVGQLSQRLQEAVRLGFRRAVVPSGSGLTFKDNIFDLEILEAENIEKALVMALGQDSVDVRS